MATFRGKSGVSNVRYLYDSKNIETANFIGTFDGTSISERVGYDKAVARSKTGKNVVMSATSAKRCKPESVKVGNETYYAYKY